MKQFTQKTVGRCLTEYKHVNYEALVNTADGFYKMSQFDTLPVFDDIPDIGYFKEMPKCSYGEIIFALIGGGFIEVYSIIDSSD